MIPVPVEERDRSDPHRRRSFKKDNINPHCRFTGRRTKRRKRMNAVLIGEAAVIGFCFVAWTIIGSRFASGSFAATIVAVMTALMVSIFSLGSVRAGEYSDWRIWGALVLLGLLNGFGLVRYADKLSQPGIPTAAFVVTVSVAMVAIAPLLESIVGGKQISAGHLVGYAFAACAIFFLAK